VAADSILEQHRSEILAAFERVGTRYGVSDDEFATTVAAVVAKYLFGKAEARPSRSDVRSFLESLHSGDLVIAIACARGNEEAWEEFVREHGAYAKQCARQLAFRYRWPDSAEDDLVESLWGDLFGLRSESGRASKFGAYAGLGSLRGWLRAVLYQIAVDRHRGIRESVPIEDVEHRVVSRRSESGPLSDRYTSAAREALTTALSELDSERKLILSYYYFDELTLKQIGELYGVHEATASRWVARAQSEVRKSVERILKRQFGFNSAQIEASLASAAKAEGLNIQELLGKNSGGK